MDVLAKSKMFKRYRGDNCFTHFIVELQKCGIVSIPIIDTRYDLVVDDGTNVYFVIIDPIHQSCFCPLDLSYEF